MKVTHLSSITLLVLSFPAISIMMLERDTTYPSSADIGIYDCVALYQDSVSIECSVLLAYRGDLPRRYTVSIPLFQYLQPPPVEIGDTLLVFAGSSWVTAYGLHHAGYTLMSRNVGEDGLNVLSDYDLSILQRGDSLGERRFRVKITVHFPLSENKIEFAFDIDESHNEPVTASIPGLGLFEVDLNINRFREGESSSPVFFQFMPANNGEPDYSRKSLNLRGSITCYQDGIYYIDSQMGSYFSNEDFLTYEDLIRFINDVDLYSGALQLEIETTDSENPEIAYLTVTETNAQDMRLNTINLHGVTNVEVSRSQREWNCAYFTSEGFYDSGIQGNENVIELRIPDKPVDGLRNFKYCLFNLSRYGSLNADLSSINLSTGESSPLAEVRINPFTPEYGIRTSRTPGKRTDAYIEELLYKFCICPSDSEIVQNDLSEQENSVSGFEFFEQDNEIDITLEDGSRRRFQIVAPWNPEGRMRAKLAYNDGSDILYNLWQIIFGEEEMEIQLKFDETGNASL